MRTMYVLIGLFLMWVWATEIATLPRTALWTLPISALVLILLAAVSKPEGR